MASGARGVCVRVGEMNCWTHWATYGEEVRGRARRSLFIHRRHKRVIRFALSPGKRSLMSSTEYVPLSAAQQSLWYAQQLSPEIPIHIAQYIEIEGPLDASIFDEVARIAAHEVESVHIRLAERDSIPYQIFEDVPESSIPLVDFTNEEDPLAAARAWMDTDLHTPFVLLGERLYRTAMLRLAPDRHLWYLCGHHIAIDGYSGPAFSNRMAEIYTDLVEGRG